MKRCFLSLGWLILAGCGSGGFFLETPVGGDQFRLPGGFAPERAKEILTQAADVYASSESYMDEGLVSTTFIYVDRERIVEKPFTTAFVRPERFRYEFRDDAHESRKYIVARDGELVQTWWDVGDRLTESDDLSLAVAGATGVSSGSAHAIPRLLMPETIGGFGLNELESVELLGEEEIDGVACHKIQGEQPQDRWRVLWIEKERMLIRKIERQTQFQTFRTRSTTTYEPQINIEISPDELVFDYPPS